MKIFCACDFPSMPVISELAFTHLSTHRKSFRQSIFHKKSKQVNGPNGDQYWYGQRKRKQKQPAAGTALVPSPLLGNVDLPSDNFHDITHEISRSSRPSFSEKAYDRVNSIYSHLSGSLSSISSYGTKDNLYDCPIDSYLIDQQRRSENKLSRQAHRKARQTEQMRLSSSYAAGSFDSTNTYGSTTAQQHESFDTVYDVGQESEGPPRYFGRDDKIEPGDEVDIRVTTEVRSMMPSHCQLPVEVQSWRSKIISVTGHKTVFVQSYFENRDDKTNYRSKMPVEMPVFAVELVTKGERGLSIVTC